MSCWSQWNYRQFVTIACHAACYAHFIEYFKRADEEGKGQLLGDAFKTVLSDMEGEYAMSFLTERFTSRP